MDLTQEYARAYFRENSIKPAKMTKSQWDGFCDAMSILPEYKNMPPSQVSEIKEMLWDYIQSDYFTFSTE